MTEAEFIELCIWTTCESASGAGKGKCDPWHCVCGNEGTFLASKLWPLFASIRAAEREACAKIAEKAADDLVSTVGLHQEASSRCYNIASRIRARATDGRGE